MFLPLRDDNPLHRIGFQFVTLALIAACTIVWAVQAIGGDQFDAELVFRLGMIPVTVLGELRREPDMVAVTPWLTIVTLDVSARGLHAPVRQHALSLDFRGQRRRRDGPLALRDLLSPLRRGGGAHPRRPWSPPRRSPPSARAAPSRASSAPTSCFIPNGASGSSSSSCRCASPPGPCSGSGSAIRSSTRSSPARPAAGSPGTPTSAASLPVRCWWCRCGSAACPSSTVVSAVHGGGRPTGRRLRPRAPEWGRGKSRLPMRPPIRKPTAMPPWQEPPAGRHNGGAPEDQSSTSGPWGRRPRAPWSRKD